MATESDKVNNGALATLVLVGTFATISIILGVDALVRYEQGKLSAERASHASEHYRSVVAEQNAKLAAPPGWADKGKGLVTMPIHQAMGHVVADLVRDPLSASPVPPPAADAGTEAAPAPSGSAPGELGAAPTTPEGGAEKAPVAPASASAAVVPAKAPAPHAAGSVSPKSSTVLAVPPAAPAAPPKAPAPAAPAPTDG